MGVNNCNIRVERSHQWSHIAAQTNSRLLAVLSELIKAFIYSESAITSTVSSLGLREQGDAASDHALDNNELSSLCTVASMNILNENNGNHLLANNLNGDPMTEMIDDNPESASLLGIHDPAMLNDLIGHISMDDDIVLGASRRLRTAVDNLLKILKKLVLLQSHQPPSVKQPVTSTPAQKTSRTSKTKSASPLTTVPRHNKTPSSMGAVTSGSRKPLNADQIENQVPNQTDIRPNVTQHTDEIARRRSLSPPESLIVDVEPPFNLGRPRPSLLFEKTDLANLDDLSSLSDPESLDSHQHGHRKPGNNHKFFPSYRSNKSLHSSESTDESNLTALYNQIINDKDNEITLLKEQMKLAQDMLSSTFGCETLEKVSVLDQVDLLGTLNSNNYNNLCSNKRDSTASSIASKQDNCKLQCNDENQVNKPSHLTASTSSKGRTRPKQLKSKKNKFAGVDLIGPLAEHMPSTSTSGQITPKSNLGSSNCLSFNRPQSNKDLVDDGYDELSNDNSQKEVARMDCGLEQLQNMILLLVDKDKQKQKQLDQIKSQLTAKEQQIRQLAEDKTQLQGEIENLRTEKTALSQQLKEKEDEMTNASVAAKNTYDRQVLYYKKAIDLKNEEIASYEERISGLLRKIDALKNDSEQNKTFGKAEQAEFNEQIQQLKKYIKDQAKEINSYEAKVASLLSKIESLKLQNDLMKSHEKRIEELEFQIKTAEEISIVKRDKIKQLMDTISKQSNEIKLLTQPTLNMESSVKSKCHVTRDASVEAKIASKWSSLDIADLASGHLQLHLLKKTLHEKRSLIYQKQYLLNVLSGFQMSEQAILALMSNMGDASIDDSYTRLMKKTTLNSGSLYLDPKSRFRSAVYAVISLTRMKKLVAKWSLPK